MDRDLYIQILEYYRCLDTNDIPEDEPIPDWKRKKIEAERLENGDEEEDEENTVPDIFGVKFQRKIAKTQAMIIKIFGNTPTYGDELKRDDSICVNVINFQPFFFVSIPNEWDSKKIDKFAGYLSSKVPKIFREHLIRYERHLYKPFTHFTADDKFAYLQLFFLNKEGYDAYSRLLEQPHNIYGLTTTAMEFTRSESNIDPIIKFIHKAELNSTGWIKINAGKYKISKSYDRTTTTKHEITVDCKDIQYFDSINMAKIKQLAFDIEADSSHGDFPVAIKTYKKLAQDLITIYNKYGMTTKTTKQHHLFKNSPDKVILNLLKLAFNSNYTNAGIGKLSEPLYSLLKNDIKTTKDFFNTYIAELIEEAQLHQINIINGNEELNENENEVKIKVKSDYVGVYTSKYETLSSHIIKQIRRLFRIKDLQFITHRNDVIKNMIECAVDPYNDGFDISKVYTKGNVKPKGSILEQLVEYTLQVLRNCAGFIHNKKTPERDLQIEIPFGDIKPETFVNLLEEFFGQYLPPVEGDKCIQIGSTIQIFNQSDCYLKHIICLDTTNTITNDEMIEAENASVYLPAEDLAIDLTNMEIESNQRVLSKDEKKSFIKTRSSEIQAMSKDERRGLCAIVAKYRCGKQLKTDTSKVIVEYYRTEKEVLLAWTRLIVSEDPDIVTGYNIFGFDFSFLYRRAQELNILDDFMKFSRLKDYQCQLKEIKVSSAAMGDIRAEYIEMTGRVVIDLYKYIQKTQVLDNYKLDYVCGKFLYKEKMDLSPQNIFIKQRGNSADRQYIAKYCLIDCILCNRLLTKLDVIGNAMAMATVCKVPLSYVYNRGQGVKIASLATYMCEKNGYRVHVLPQADEENQGYEGAIVLTPQIGIHFEPTVTLDFNSLYPSSMISENLSHCSFVERGGKYDNLPEYEYVDITYDEFEWKVAKKGKKKKIKVKVGENTCRYVQLPNGKKSTIPMILMELLSERKKAKKQMESATDEFTAKLYNAKQLAYKTVANSVYGQTGAPTGLLFKPEIAASTTAVGRRMIIFSRDYIKKAYKYAIVKLERPYTDDDDGNPTPFEGREFLVTDSYCVYGDTDSVFVRFNMYNFTYSGKVNPDGSKAIIKGEKITGRDAIFCSMALGKRVAKEISNQLKKPQNLDFEKVITPFILFSKKRYCGHYYTKMNKDYYYLNSMGIVLKRRDNAPIVKHIYGGVIKEIMNNHDIAKAYQFLQTECKKLLRGEFPMEMFTVSKTLKGFYKFPNRIAHNVLAMRQAQRDPGNKFSSNDRVPYVYIVPTRETPKTGQGKTAKYKQGDIIETPQFIIDNKLKINYALYLTNQIQVPVSQIFKLEKGYENIDKMFSNLIECQKAEDAGMKRLDETFLTVDTSKKQVMDLKTMMANAKKRHDDKIMEEEEEEGSSEDENRSTNTSITTDIVDIVDIDEEDGIDDEDRIENNNESVLDLVE